jgi:hypothetical protein
MVGEFSANAAFCGYLYQIRYSLFLLLTAREDNPKIFLETFDDISCHSEKGTNLYQVKHITSSISNASENLWKTLRIWCTAINDGSINLTNAKFTIITTGTATKGSIAYFLRPPSIENCRDEEKALKLLNETATTSHNKDNSTIYSLFLEMDDSLKKELIKKIQILDSVPDILGIENKIQKELKFSCRPDFIKSIYTRLEGWWFDRIIVQLSSSRESIKSLSQDELLNKIYDINEEFHEDNLPIDFLGELNIDENDLPDSKKIFIEQLKLISIQKPRLRFAIHDYYRAYQQRFKWIREELLLDNELKNYETRLIEEWSRIFETMKEEIDSNSPESEKVKKGRELFEWMEQRCDKKIREKCTEPYVIRGSFHMLADDLKVGWHVNFVERLEHLLITH